MPAFDGTGPGGMGPMTGGGRGWCNPYGIPYSGARFAPYAPYGAPGMYARPYGAYASPYWSGRPRWGLRLGLWGRGRGMGRRRW